MSRVHSLYILNINNESYFIPILLKYTKYNTYDIVLSIVDNFLKLQITTIEMAST